MGNKSSVDNKGSGRSGRVASQPYGDVRPSGYHTSSVAYGNYLRSSPYNSAQSSEFGLHVTDELSAQSSEFGLQVTDELIDEQSCIYSAIQTELSNRNTAESRAKEEEQRLLRERQEKERLRLEEQRRQEALAESRQREEASAPPIQREEASAPPIHVLLPDVCRRHNSRQGCSGLDCRRLHICRQFLADICKYGATCRFVHSLTTVHNQAVCSRYDLDTTDATSVELLRRAFEINDELPESMYLNNLEICYKYSSKSSCYQNDCKRIHICRQYVAGVCERVVCKFTHNLHTTHNQGVISRHRLTNMADRDILKILRQKEKGEYQKVSGTATTTSSPKNGAIPRQPTQGASSQLNPGTQAGGRDDQSGISEKGPSRENLSEELQCPICLELFKRATTLGCGHTFCAGCLQEVRDRSGDTCPLCRAHISSVIRSVTLDNIVRSMAAKK